VVINLPKLKTHQMMGLTCAVKNLFGAVVGMRKPGLHLQAGADKAFFALMLLELADFLRPALTIVDAVTAMEGNGPGSGDPVHVGALLAGAEPLAIDAAAIELLGMRAESVWTQRVAREKLLPGSRLEEIEIVGADLRSLRPRAFQPAKSTEIHFGLPAFLREPLKQSVTAWPVVDTKACLLCGLCVEHCPPQAMAIEDKRLTIDYKRCIGCFCCQELCPRNALITRQGLLLRLNRFITRR
jgi:Pyruvate/2-oxoacid:ferredoxin oxidoreductase delta subunit